MEKIIIGLTGSLCSGKGTVANHLIDLGFNHQILSDRIREEIKSRGQEITRTLLQDVGNELRLTYGGAVLAERTLEIIAHTEGNIVIDGVRNPDEINFLRESLNAKIIGVHAPKEKRLEWYLERVISRGEDGKTSVDFERDDNRDFGIGEPENGQQVGKCLEMANIVLWNAGSKADLYRECDNYFRDVLKFDPEIHHPNIEKK